MKKSLFVFLYLLSALSTLSLADVKYTGHDGYLVMPNVNVDDQTFYDSVTLQLDFAKGTFSLVDAKPKAVTVSETPLQQFEYYKKYTVGLLGCAGTGEIIPQENKDDERVIACSMQVINNGEDVIERFPSAPAIGNVGGRSRTYDLSSGTKHSSGGVLESLELFLPKGQPLKISFKINLSINANSISSLCPMRKSALDCDSRVQASFNDIKF